MVLSGSAISFNDRSELFIRPDEFSPNDTSPPTNHGNDDSKNITGQLHEVDQKDPHPRMLRAIVGEYPFIRSETDLFQQDLDTEITDDIIEYFSIYENPYSDEIGYEIDNKIAMISLDLYSRDDYLSESKLFLQLLGKQKVTIRDLLDCLERINKTGELEDLIT